MGPVEVSFTALSVVGVVSFLAGVAFVLLLVAGYLRKILWIQQELLDRLKWRRGEDA